ncbi:hypothetical protein OV450_3389 [Actinobacteria bacterium OV450]|nr:hypothetical protein OV450_3389 [Actinobacteria bacterium OV450]
MARIQTMMLPNCEYIIIIDQLTTKECDDLAEQKTSSTLADLTGAKAVICWENGTLDVQE